MATCPFVLYKIQNKIQKYESRFALRNDLHGKGEAGQMVLDTVGEVCSEISFTYQYHKKL